MSNFTNTFKIIIFALLFAGAASAQKFMGVGTDKPNPRSVLELKVEDPVNFQQGFLPPRLTTVQRIAFGTVSGMATLQGMTVFDTNLNAFFVWDGTTWLQLAITAGSANISAVGLGGINVTSSGLGLTIDGANLVKQTTSGLGNLTGDFLNGFSITGIGAYSITGVPTSGVGSVMSFDGVGFKFVPITSSQVTSVFGINGALVTGNVPNGFSVDGSNFLKTVTGTNGIIATSLAGGNFAIDGSAFLRTITGSGGIVVGSFAGGGFSIDGSNFQTSSVFGINGALVTGNVPNGFSVDGSNFLKTVTGINGIIATSLAGGNFRIDGSAFLKTITGSGGIVVGSIVGGGFSIDGSNFTATSVVGISGATVLGSGSLLSVSGAGLVVLQQTLVNAVGSGSSAGLGTGLPVFKALVRIPAGVKNLSASLNAYTLNGTAVSFRVDVNGATFQDVAGVTNTSVDNFENTPNINVSLVAGGPPVLIKVYANVGTAGEAAYIQGVTLTVKD